MAKVTAPLLSLGASGKFADTLVASTWKGQPVLRKYVVPSNPDTIPQQTHRALMTNAVRIWRTYFTDPTMRTAWQTLATKAGLRMSGFNKFTSEVMPIYAATISMVATQGSKTAATFTLTTKNVVDGIAGTEGGTFDLWMGTSLSNIQLHSAIGIAAGNLIYDIHTLYPAGTDVWYYIVKHGADSYRSGIFASTVA